MNIISIKSLVFNYNLKLELDKLVSNLYGISQEELDEIRMDMSLLLNTSEKDENTDLDGEDPQE